MRSVPLPLCLADARIVACYRLDAGACRKEGFERKNSLLCVVVPMLWFERATVRVATATGVGWWESAAVRLVRAIRPDAVPFADVVRALGSPRPVYRTGGWAIWSRNTIVNDLWPQLETSHVDIPGFAGCGVKTSPLNRSLSQSLRSCGHGRSVDGLWICVVLRAAVSGTFVGCLCSAIASR